jgi:hypothetical protein
MFRQLTHGLSTQRVGESFLQQTDSAAQENDGEEATQATESTRDAGPDRQNMPGTYRGGRAIFSGRGIGRHALFFPGILQDQIRRECLQSVLFAFPEKIEVAKDGWVIMFFHDRAAQTVSAVHFSVPTCSDG